MVNYEFSITNYGVIKNGISCKRATRDIPDFLKEKKPESFLLRKNSG